MRRILSIFLIFFTCISCIACGDFLSERHTSSIANISSLQDLQQMMDAGNTINFGSYSLLMEAATDDFFIGTVGFDMANEFEQSNYLWQMNAEYPQLYENEHWRGPYHVIAIANNVLDELPNVQITKGLSSEMIEGTALFHRAFTYLNLVQIYCKAYDPITADRDLGLPMRLSPDINLPSERASLAETYRIIEQDISNAIRLLPETSEFQTRPNKVAAHALMARFYLLMDRYEEALAHADQALSRYDRLMDLNDLDASRPYPFDAMNEETIFFAYSTGVSMLTPSRECYLDTLLINSYKINDLRKTLYFNDEHNGYYTFRGSYIGLGSSSCFVGLTVSELMLIRSESLARMEMLDDSMQSLNTLLHKRYLTGHFKPLAQNDAEDLLIMILEERRKELVFRGVRWGDLKRLNKDPRFAKTLFRKIPGYEEVYELPPGDPRYVFPIPQIVVDMTGMEQNPR